MCKNYAKKYLIAGILLRSFLQHKMHFYLTFLFLNDKIVCLCEIYINL